MCLFFAALLGRSDDFPPQESDLPQPLKFISCRTSLSNKLPTASITSHTSVLTWMVTEEHSIAFIYLFVEQMDKQNFPSEVKALPAMQETRV